MFPETAHGSEHRMPPRDSSWATPHNCMAAFARRAQRHSNSSQQRQQRHSHGNSEETEPQNEPIIYELIFSAKDWRCSIDQGHFESMTEDTGSCKMMRLRQRAWHNINSNSEWYWLVKRDFHSGWWESAWCQAVQSHIAISPQGRIGYCSSDFWEYCALVKADWKLWAEQLCHH